MNIKFGVKKDTSAVTGIYQGEFLGLHKELNYNEVRGRNLGLNKSHFMLL